MSFPTLLLHTVGGFGSSVAGIIMIYRMGDKFVRKDFWRRCVDFRQVGLRWVILILVFFPFLALVSIGMARLIGAPSHVSPHAALLLVSMTFTMTMSKGETIELPHRL